MLNLDSSWEQDDSCFLLSSDRKLSFREAFLLAKQIFTDDRKEVVLIKASQDIDTVVYYLACLLNNKVALLVEEGQSEDLVNNYIELYQPSYIYNSRTGQLDKREPSIEYNIDEALQLLLPTSGTTGDPKTVRLSKSSIHECTRSVVSYLDLNSSRIAISSLPLYYSYGLSVLHNAIYTRSTYFVTDKSIIDRKFWQELIDYKITDLALVPFTLDFFLKFRLPLLETALDTITVAGGAVRPDKVKILLEQTKNNDISVFLMYGQTEASPRIAYASREQLEVNIETVGVPIQCGRISLKKDDPNDSIGELVYYGPNVALGYASGFQDLNKGDQFEGTLETGDLAKIENELITIVGRKKRVIKLAGKRVSLDSIEKRYNSESFKTAAIGDDDNLVLITMLKDKKALKTRLVNELNLSPSHIRVVSTDSIPVMNNGKINYKILIRNNLR